MDPVTAAFNAFAAFNQFLCTQPGQVVATNANAVIVGLLNHFNAHLAANEPKPVATPIVATTLAPAAKTPAAY